MSDTAATIPSAGLLSRRKVLELTGIGDTTLWRYEAAGKFPRKFNLGPRRVAWRAKDIAEWLEDPEAWVAKNAEISG
jgi:prophage regulatory protein